MKKKIKAQTLAVVQNENDSITCGLYVGEEYTNITLRFDRGNKAVICGYPQPWLVHDVPVESFNSESPTGKELYSADGVDDEQNVYISESDEEKILLQLKVSLEAQFNDDMFKDRLTKKQKQVVFKKMDNAIEALR